MEHTHKPKKKPFSFLWFYLIVAAILAVAVGLFALLYSGNGAGTLLESPGNELQDPGMLE